MKFLKKVWDAIKNFEKYEDFALEETKSVLKYFFQLIVLFIIIISITFTYRFYILANQMVEYFKTEIPDLTFEDGNLQMASEQPKIIEIKEGGVSMIIIDTHSEERLAEYRNKIDLFGSGVIVLKDRMIIRNHMLENEMVYDYKTIAQNYGIPNFDKPMVEQFLAKVTQGSTYVIGFFVISIYMFIIYMLSTLLDAVMLGILAWILAKMAAIKMRLKNGFHIGIYALTLPILLNMIYIVINQLTGFYISKFQWMYSMISYIYVFIAILMIRSDLIHRKIELVKLQEEQEKIREELKQETQQEQKKEKKEEPEEKETTDEKEGQQPEGSEA